MHIFLNFYPPPVLICVKYDFFLQTMWPQVPFIAHFDIFHIIKFNKIFDISQYMFVGQYIPTSTAASDINLFSACNQLLFWKFENLFLGNTLSRQKKRNATPSQTLL